MRVWIGSVLAGLCILLLEAPMRQQSPFEIYGIDVSHYQSRVNWDLVAEEGIQFVFVKATEGMSHQDSLFCLNWGSIKEAGLKRGAYHFFRPGVPADHQAHNFMELVQLEEGDMPPVLDIEVLDDATQEELVEGVRAWLQQVELRYHIKPILYTNLKFYYKYLYGQFEDYPIWIARYNAFQPRLGRGKDWHFWQYANKGRMKGIFGDVDFNVFRGDWAEFDSICLPPIHSITPEEENTFLRTRPWL
ncbi:MAG: glycoside hydrolase family 25 protein [Saprospirales bacterium]|nr:glycoside hydrolase family 25 protein [Saprospirales bacterium]MBK8489808.1 glycoside hydrolase family 25 protein [Saprospirales bacterium]